jgi:dsDNA-specific endonuclease/ATPase MutS2
MEYFTEELVKKNIDFDYVLNMIEVITPYGLKHKKTIKPYMPGEEESLRDELDRVDRFIQLLKKRNSNINHLRGLFCHIKDLTNTVVRCVKGDILTVVQLFEIKNFIFLLREISESLEELELELPKDLKVQPIPELEAVLDPEKTGVKTFYIYDSYSERLKRIREDKKNIQKKINLERKKIIDSIRKELGVNIRPNGETLVLKSQRELISKIEKHPLLIYNSETYMNIRYSIKSTEVIDNLQTKLQDIKKIEEEEELNIRAGLSRKVGIHSKGLFANMEIIGKLDFTIAKADMALKIGGVKPEITDKHIIDIIDGRHLKVEKVLKEKGMNFIPISIKLKEGVTCITGANMGGKSVTLRLIGLLSAMAQHGIFVPCSEMKMGLHEFIYLSTGDNQSTDAGLSTFGAEINGLKKAIKNSERRGLILIDELARGTNPEEGYAISKAIVNYLNRKKSITVITTHYDNVADSEGVVHLQVIGLSNIDFKKLKDDIKEDKLIGIETITRYMDYRLKRITGRKEVPRDAVNIAWFMGLEEEIIKEAEEILNCKGGNNCEK